jgi:RNA polymerase sigma-70 factor (ECF subfamily)
VYRARAGYKPSAKFTTWLFRIATNLALNAVRDERHRQRDVSIEQPGEGRTPEDDPQPLEVADRRPGIVEALLERDRAAFIQRAILRLPEKQRAAVLMHKYHEMDYDQIAEALECSESALKSLLFRAYEALRVELAPLVRGEG